MNGVEVLNTASTNVEAFDSNMPVDENVVSSDETMIESGGTSGEEGKMNEVKSEQGLGKLKITLQNQLEYYFSSENLLKDQYLVSQMDDQHYVPIWTIANFNLVKNLTTDINLITEVLKSSTLVQVDERNEKVRPNKTKYVLILREIPEETPIENVEGLFEGYECPRFISCEFAANTSWYVTFETETDAQAAYRHLREKVKTFLGQPIMARIKSRTHHLNSYGSSKINQPAPPQVSMPNQILSPTFIPTSFVPQPGPPFTPGAGGQPPPFIAAIATQPQGATSPNSSVSTTVAPVYVIPPPGGQPWGANLYPTPEQMGFGNQHFSNAVFHHQLPQQQVGPASYMTTGKGPPMFRNKNFPNNNFMGGDMHAGRMQENHVMQIPMNPPTTDSRPPHYLPAVAHAQMQSINGQPNVYSQSIMRGPFYKNQPPMNKSNGNKQNGNMSNGVGGGGRYNNRNNISNPYHPHPQHDVDISPRFQKKGMQPAHQRYSTSRNTNSQEFANRHSSEGGMMFHNGPSNISSQESYPFLSRNNSTGHESNAMPPGSRFVARQGYPGQKYPNQESAVDSSGTYNNVSDVNNNSAKVQIFGNDTVNYSDPNNRNGGPMSLRQRKPRRNGGDSRTGSSRPSPPAPPLNGPISPEQSFNLENTSFPPLPGTASNTTTIPNTTSTDTVVNKPHVQEESYKNSLKMNLDKVQQPPPAPVMTSSSSATTPQPSPAAAVVRSQSVAKEETMQSVVKEESPKKDAAHGKDTHHRHTAPTSNNNIHHHHHHHHHGHGKSPGKTPKSTESQKNSAPPASDTKRHQSHEKSNKSNHKHHSRTHKSNTTVENNNKGKSEPTTKPITGDQSTVPSADSDAGKKLSYAAMLRKQTPKPNVPVVVDENENHIDAKKEQPAEERPTSAPVQRPAEKTQAPGAVDGKNVEKVPSTPPEDSENGEEKPWESAGHTKRSHRTDRDRAPSDQSHHNGYDSRDGGHQRGGRGGGRGGPRGKGRGRGYWRGGSRSYVGRDRYNSAGNERSPATTNGDLPQRKR